MTDLFTEPEMTILDRSTLEAWATCPFAAAGREAGLVTSVGLIARAGEEVHQAIGRTLRSYLDSDGMLSLSDLVHIAGIEIRSSQPDVQPEAVKAFRASMWAFIRYVTGLHFVNILRFDGGEGKRSGQLAWDVESLGVRVTSEVDLLHATPSKALLSEVDWKSGWKCWTAEAVRDSFQFQLHAWLIFNNYPDVEGVQVTIWNLRTNRRAWPVEFERRDLQAINTRMLSAIEQWGRYHGKPLDDVPTWPAREKCPICDTAAICPAADGDIVDLRTDPGHFVDVMHAVECRFNAMKKLAAAYVTENGDIMSPSGMAFGPGKPKADRKPPNSLYQTKQETTDDDDA